MTYEKNVGKELKRRKLPGKLYEHQWIAFIDQNGRGYAQTDYFLETESNIILFESKLTQRGTALTQMGHLYRPLLQHIFKKPVVGLQVCKNMLWDPGKWEVREPEALLGYTAEDLFTWHWMGR